MYPLIPYPSLSPLVTIRLFFKSVGTTLAMLGNTLNDSCDYLPYIIEIREDIVRENSRKNKVVVKGAELLHGYKLAGVSLIYSE